MNALSFLRKRRICPGREFADSAVWLATARILSCFDVALAVENGEAVQPPDMIWVGVL